MKRISRSGIGTTAGFGLASFSKDELDTIHYATLQILQDTGIKVLSENALEIFDGGGCEIERFNGYGIVKIPSYVVEECAFWSPRMIVYDGRNPDDDFVAEPTRVGFTTFGGCINIIDPLTPGINMAIMATAPDRACNITRLPSPPPSSGNQPMAMTKTAPAKHQPFKYRDLMDR